MTETLSENTISNGDACMNLNSDHDAASSKTHAAVRPATDSATRPAIGFFQFAAGRAVSRVARPALTLGLVSLLLVHPAVSLAAPFPDGPAKVADLPDAPYPESEGLTIEILDGEGALNNIRQRTAREPIVQVEDKNHKPVGGALVLFSINTGSSGAGANVAGLSTFSVRTGVDGRAQLKGLQPNNVSGEFTITVTATAGTLTATAIIHQRNDPGTGASSNNTSSSQAGGGQTASTVAGQVLRHPHNFVTIGSIVGGVAVAGLVVGLVVTTRTSGARITAGTGTVTAP